MPYGSIKVDNIVFTNGGSDQTITVSGLIASTSGNLTVTGTVQGGTIIGTSTISGATITGNTGQFTTLTGGTAGFTTVTGTTVTGTTANFASGVFTTQISGATVTGNVGSFATITGGVVTLTSGVFAAGSASAPSISFSSDSNTGIYSPGADQVAISASGTQKLLVNSNGISVTGNISIPYATAGSASSGDPTISQLAANTGVGTLTTNAAGQTLALTTYFDASQIAFRAGSNNQAGIQIGGTSSTLGSTIQFATNNSERLRITSSGLVGVGTSSPSNLFHVSGTAGTLALFERTGSNGVFIALKDGSANNVFLGNTNGVFSVQTPGSSFSDKLVVTSAGNVGVGTSGPQGLLHVEGVSGNAPVRIVGSSTNSSALALYNNAATTNRFVIGQGFASGSDNVAFIQNDANAAMVFGTNATERLRITAGGLVGIGTSSPGGQLEVFRTSTTDPALRLRYNSTSYYADHLMDGNGNYVIYSPAANGVTSGNLRLRAGSSFSISTNDQAATSPALTIDTSGRVGIGDNGPDSTLTVKAATGVTPFKVSGPSSEFAKIDSSGRLLIGTSTARANYSGITPNFQFEHGIGNNQRSFAITHNDIETAGPVIFIGKSRGSTVGSNTVVASGDELGQLIFNGADGTNMIQGASIRAEVDGTPGANDMPGRLVFSTTADGASSPTERMRIPSSGGLLINATSRINDGLTTIGFQGSIQKGLVLNDTDPANTRQFIGFHISGTTQIGYIANSNNTGVTYSTSSDYRLKENVAAVTDGISRLKQLKPSRFNFISAPDHRVDGFIAHEVQTIVPEAITGEKDAVDDDGNPVYQGIDQSKLVPLLTAALQEAINEIESLKARLTAAGI